MMTTKWACTVCGTSVTSNETGQVRGPDGGHHNPRGDACLGVLRQLIALLCVVADTARGCAVSEDNPDTCGVCGCHFAECDADKYSGGRLVCSGGRVRQALANLPQEGQR